MSGLKGWGQESETLQFELFDLIMNKFDIGQKGTFYEKSLFLKKEH